jgi:hypothetical protein
MVAARSEWQNALREIRWRRKRTWVLFFAYLPVCAVAALCFSALGIGEYGVMTFAAGWMVLFLLSGIDVGTSRCPRCGLFFHWRQRRFGPFMVPLGSNPWVRKCMNCGLPLRHVTGQ